MHHALKAVLAVVPILVLSGCFASQSDVETVGRYGGLTTPRVDGPLANLAPVAAVDFSTHRRVIDDDDFAALFPSLERLSPRRICLGGQPISDRSIELLNRLPYLRVINLEGTHVSAEGLGRIRMDHWD